MLIELLGFKNFERCFLWCAKPLCGDFRKFEDRGETQRETNLKLTRVRGLGNWFKAVPRARAR